MRRLTKKVVIVIVFLACLVFISKELSRLRPVSEIKRTHVRAPSSPLPAPSPDVSRSKTAERTGEEEEKEEAQEQEQKDKGSASRTEVKLILLSYMRSGSSFTADLFNKHAEVFYIYEPLWHFDFAFKGGKPMEFLDGRPPVRKENDDDVLVDVLKKSTVRSVLSCELEHIGSLVYKVIKRRFARDRTDRIQDFLDCWVRDGIVVRNMTECLPLLQKDCDSARVTLVKVLRLSMKQAFALMEFDPKVKVIHLVRDPRGVLTSRRVSGVGRGAGENAEIFCDKVLQDVKESMVLRKVYPGRVLTVRYEDLVAEPLSYTQALLQFAGLDFSPAHRAYVWNITSTGLNITSSLRTVSRSDAKSTASSWRLQSTARFVEDADDKCSFLYEQLGYLGFADENALRNLSQPYYTHCSNMKVPAVCVQ